MTPYERILRLERELRDIKKKFCCLENEAGGGGEALRFAVSGEDDTAAETRFFTMGTNNFVFSGSNGAILTQEIVGAGSSYASFALLNESLQTQVVNTTGTGIASFTLSPIGIQFGHTGGRYFFSDIAEYADNAAALADGLTPGALYRTGDLLKIVHL